MLKYSQENEQKSTFDLIFKLFIQLSVLITPFESILYVDFNSGVFIFIRLIIHANGANLCINLDDYESLTI